MFGPDEEDEDENQDMVEGRRRVRLCRTARVSALECFACPPVAVGERKTREKVRVREEGGGDRARRTHR